MGHGLDETHGKWDSASVLRKSETKRGEYGYGGICGHGLDETHDKWGVVSGLYRVDVGGLWQIGGLRKEIEASVYGYGGSIDAMLDLLLVASLWV